MIRFVTEAQLAEVVIAWLEALGGDVFQEVELSPQGKRADIVARVRGEIWIIETKTSVSLELLGQAMDRRRHATRIYIAAPSGRSRSSDVCAELGIGLLTVSPGDNYDGPQVREVVPSRRWNRRPTALAGKLRPEHKTHARAGAPTGGHWSPFRETCQEMARVVAQSPGIELRIALSGIKHHYRSNAGARSSMATWIRAGKVPGVRIEGGKLYPTEGT